MYLFITILLIVMCLGGIIYINRIKSKYKNDDSSLKEDIVNYFKEHRAYSLDSGIEIKDLPTDIAKSPYLLLMVKDKTLSFGKGKYYLNINK